MSVINPSRLWKLRKGIFGLTEAPRLWWLGARGDLLERGWSEVKAAPATFILKNTKNQLCGLSVLHDDGGLLRGSGELYEASLRKLRKRVPLKIWANQDTAFASRDARRRKARRPTMLTSLSAATSTMSNRFRLANVAERIPRRSLRPWR